MCRKLFSVFVNAQRKKKFARVQPIQMHMNINPISSLQSAIYTRVYKFILIVEENRGWKKSLSLPEKKNFTFTTSK